MPKKKTRTTDWKEKCRFHAVVLEGEGWKQKGIAVALNVNKSAVRRWLTASKEKGVESLRAHPHTGRPAELTSTERRLIPEFLSYGAEAYGFRGELWTCARVGKVMEMELGVSYHKSHVARLLKELKWTPQQPIERAAQRDETEIARWRKAVWLEMKKKPVWNTESSFLWTNRAFISCRRLSGFMRHVAKRPSCVSSKPATICR